MADDSSPVAVPPPRRASDTLTARLVGQLREAGCVSVGACGVEPLVEAREVIERRRSAGLHDGMQFTFRDPARSTDPRTALPSARSALVAAWPYRHSVDTEPPEPSAAVARYAASNHYDRLRTVLSEAAAVLSRAGHRAVVVVDDNALADRAVALRAGLGWQGKNTNLLVPGVGSWVLIGSILTDADLARVTGSERSGHCGGCRRCLDGCPTGALPQPGTLDASRCLSWLLQRRGSFPREHRRALGNRIYGCDDCQEVCPPNRLAPGEPPHAIASATTGDWVGVRFLLEGSDEELLGHLGAWYIPDRDPRFLRRNALVVLGNSRRGGEQAAVDLVQRYLRCGDDLLVEHAAWAARALGREDLLAAPELAGIEAVATELALPAPPAQDPLARSRASGETWPDGPA